MSTSAHGNNILFFHTVGVDFICRLVTRLVSFSCHILFGENHCAACLVTEDFKGAHIRTFLLNFFKHIFIVKYICL